MQFKTDVAVKLRHCLTAKLHSKAIFLLSCLLVEKINVFFTKISSIIPRFSISINDSSKPYIKGMNENNEPCMELNEIIYHISSEFWKKAYNELLRKWNFW